jgi:uncharacterized glyoxalase superfamily protein PhnB
MSESALTERLDQAIDALLRGAPARTVSTEEEVARLVNLAGDLRALPRPEFKAQLKAELEREIEMSTATKTIESTESIQPSWLPRGFRMVTPYVIVADVHQEIDFIKQAFGAEGKVYGLGSAGGFHSEYRIGDSMLMIGGGGKGSKWKGESVPAVFHLYVEHVDDVYQRAMQAGAVSLMAPADMDYGERSAGIEDVGGNHWYLATATGPSYVPEGLPDLMPYFHPVGAPRMIEFLKQAFGAEEVGVYKSPDGIVQHAKVRIGDSIVEMGEAHGPWQPRPMHFMVYVDDSDAWYSRAMKAEGAISVHEPADQPYGSRTGALQDPFGNVWYIATPLNT